LARASASPAVAERCWTLVGQHRGRIWCARRVYARTGEPERVSFDGARVLRREERQGDVVGFLHTHPRGPVGPSRRDVRTMRAWCSAFGKPLLCLIDGPVGLRGFRFSGADDGCELLAVERFRGGLFIGVESDGR
jgi:proteasome lid subunit RPN8/RPN11